MIKKFSIEADVVHLGNELSICLKADGVHNLANLIAKEVKPGIAGNFKGVLRGRVHLTIFASFVPNAEEKP